MFLSIHTREKVQDIVKRISIYQKITFQERIFVKPYQKIVLPFGSSEWIRKLNKNYNIQAFK